MMLCVVLRCKDNVGSLLNDKEQIGHANVLSGLIDYDAQDLAPLIIIISCCGIWIKV